MATYINTIASSLVDPDSLVFDATGNLFVSCSGDNKIVKINLAGVVSDFIASSLDNPRGLAFDSAGNLYCANYGSNKIVKITPAGVVSDFVTSGLICPYGLAFDSIGNLFCTSTYNSKIVKITPAGAVSDFITSGLLGLSFLILDSNNNLYYVNNGKICKRTSGGTISDFVTLNLNGPIGLAFDSTGNLYCANNNSNKIVKITPAGSVSDFVTTNLNYPRGIAINSSGIIYCADNGNSIKTFRSVIISNICFIGSTPILTDQGFINIDKIVPSTNTIRNKHIKLITKTITDDKYLVCFEKDALGHNIPLQTTIMSKNHALLYKGKMVRAKELININESIYRIKYKGELLYNILMDSHEKIIVNNIICETLNPNCEVAELLLHIETLSYDEKLKFIETMNNYRKIVKQFK